MTDFLVAISLAIALEGFAYALFPDNMKKLMSTMLEMESTSIRKVGLLAAFIGVGLVWLIKS